MKNKQDEFVLKAFIKTKIPDEIKSAAPTLIILDSIIGGYCTQLLKNPSSVSLSKSPILSAEDKNTFSLLINNSSGKAREELVFYYRLAILAESVILKY